MFFFFKQKTAYEIPRRDWSSDVCSSDLPVAPLGTEQLHFAELAVAMDNTANNTKITLVQGDTQLNPAMAVTVTKQFTSNSAILATVGPAGSQEVEAIGGLMDRAGMAFISGSATAVALPPGDRKSVV